MQLTNEIKRIFLSFAQQYFQFVHPTLIWNVDPKLTKIFIGDRNIAAPAMYEKMPSIILSRGTVAYAQTSIDQLQYQNTPIGPPQAKQRTDLVRASITYNCASQNGVEAEDIANTLYLNLVGKKDEFRQKGIHQIMGISMGEETMVRGDVSPRLYVVPVSVIFAVQTTILTIQDIYSIVVTADGNYRGQLANGTDVIEVSPNQIFGYTISGNVLSFVTPPYSGTNLLANFTGKYTLTQYTNVTPGGLANGVNHIFTLPEAVYSPYLLLSGIIVYATTTSGIYY